MKAKVSPLLLVSLAAASLMASCSPAGKPKTVEIVLVTKALDSEWWQRVKAGAEEAAKANPGVHLAVLAPEREVNVDQQVSILEDQITRGVSAIAVAPAGSSEVLPVSRRPGPPGFRCSSSTLTSTGRRN